MMTLAFTASALAGWSTLAAAWRPDANPWAKKQVWEGWQWTEGWSEKDQFYPEHFRPAGSVHVVLRNEASVPDTIALTHIDGVPVEDLVTTPQRAGKVIWYRVESPSLRKPDVILDPDDPRSRQVAPARAEPGGWAECSIRFRAVPEKTVSLRFRTKSAGHIEVPVTIKPQRVRIESISFSPRIDRVFIYLRSLDGKAITKGSVRLDGREVNFCWTQGPKPADLMLAEVRLEPAWECGSYHLLEVRIRDGTRLAHFVRAWDGYFAVGLFGPTEPARLNDAKAHGINTYFWAGPKSLDEHGLNNIPWHDIGHHRPRTREQTGALFNYNYDEPDCHDASLGSDLPWMDRLGVYAQHVVLPLIRYHRARDPLTPNLVLVDNTYKPLHWYVYGQIPDVYASDPYVPLNADQLGYVLHALDVARDASTPRPLVAVLWAMGFVFNENRERPRPQLPAEGGDMKLRPPSPEEMRIMVFYALGAGAKGLGYFCDYSDKKDDGEWIALSQNKPLWEEVGRINRDVLALAPYLSIGCPLPSGQEDEKTWRRALLCGREHIVLVVVNKRHYIGYNTRFTHAWHTPAKDVDVAVPLPAGFRRCRVREVKGGTFSPVEAAVRHGDLHLALDTVDTARAFLISAEENRGGRL